MIPFPIQMKPRLPDKEIDFAVADPTNVLVWPLTYDADTSSGTYSMGPTAQVWVTPDGLRGNSDSTSATPGSFTPAWFTTAGVSRALHANITCFGPSYQSEEHKEYAVLLGESTTNMYVFLISNETDVAGSATAGQMAVSCKENGARAAKYIYCNRHTWHFERRIPRLTSGAYQARPQALTWLDADTLLVSAHYEDQESRFFRIRASDLECTGEFSTSSYKHVGSTALDAEGQLWASSGGTASAYAVVAIDLPHSFGSQRLQASAVWDTAALAANGGLTFATVGGTDYVLVQQYLEVGTAYLYVYTTAQMASAAVVAERYKRFDLGQRIQDVHFANGKLYVSRNRETADATATGKIQRYDIATAITNTADGATLTAEATWDAPCEYPEGIDFQPTTGDLWCATEGLTAVGSSEGWLSIWSSPLDGQGVENSYLAEYDASDDSVEIRLNGRLFETTTWEPESSGALVLLGNAQNSFVGTINNVMVADGPISRLRWERLQSGYYEPYTLSSVTVPIVNPGGEAGSTAGWTTVTGVPIVATTNPAPHSGSYYLQGGGGVNFAYRQRFELSPLTGLSTATIDTLADAGKLWTRADVWQASYDAATDPGRILLRNLDATPTEQSTAYSNSISIAPAKTWQRRAAALAQANASRYVDIELQGTRTLGTNVDAKFDDVTATIYWRAT